jgi:hypothetical protein
MAVWYVSVDEYIRKGMQGKYKLKDLQQIINIS